jgi:hypothetical protein
MGLSSYSSSPWGECVREGGGTDFVAQMYIYPDRALVRNLTQKAESEDVFFPLSISMNANNGTHMFD